MQAIPERYSKYKLSPIDEFFAMGRGLQRPGKDGASAVDVPSLVFFSLQSLATEDSNSANNRTGNGEMV